MFIRGSGSESDPNPADLACNPDSLSKYLILPQSDLNMTTENVTSAICGQGTEFTLELSERILEDIDYQKFSDAVS